MGARLFLPPFAVLLLVCCNVSDESDSLFFQCQVEGDRPHTIRIDETDLQAENLSYTVPVRYVTDLELTPTEYVFHFSFGGPQRLRFRISRTSGAGIYDTIDQNGQPLPGGKRLACTKVPREGLVIAR